MRMDRFAHFADRAGLSVVEQMEFPWNDRVTDGITLLRKEYRQFPIQHQIYTQQQKMARYTVMLNTNVWEPFLYELVSICLQEKPSHW